MAGQLKLRRGTTSQLANYIGSEGELTYDTALKSLVLHDGVTLGGVKIPYLSNDLVPSAMLPTATESVIGASKVATTAIAQAGVNDTDFITPLKLKNTVIGVGDLGWIDKTGNRTLGINYTNDGKLRIVRVSGHASATGMWITATIDGKTRIISSGSGVSSVMLQAYAFIPSGKVYSININAGTLTNITWDEM